MNTSPQRKAFSLIELSVVIVIIGILIAGIIAGGQFITSVKLVAARSLSSSSPVLGITGLSAWFDATAEQGFKTAEAIDDTKISTWYDLNNQKPLIKINLTQTSSSSKPTYKEKGINGLPSIYFDGSNDLLSTSSTVLGENLFQSDQITVFIVSNDVTNTTDTSSILQWNTAANLRMRLTYPYLGLVTFDFGTATANTGRVTYTFSSSNLP